MNTYKDENRKKVEEEIELGRGLERAEKTIKHQIIKWKTYIYGEGNRTKIKNKRNKIKIYREKSSLHNCRSSYPLLFSNS